MVGEAGLEPASLAAQDPKSCVSANFTTRPETLARQKIRGNGPNVNLPRRA